MSTRNRWGAGWKVGIVGVLAVALFWGWIYALTWNSHPAGGNGVWPYERGPAHRHTTKGSHTPG